LTPAERFGIRRHGRIRTMLRRGVHILAIAIVAAVAAGGLISCNKSDKGAEIGQPTGVVGEKLAAPESASSHVRKATIRSNFPCKDGSDCTFTKFANVPKLEADCACLAACIPFVINVAERDRRETANKKFCGEGKRSGDGCPSTPCGFISFEEFKCVDGRCMGHARVE
jgi:hypothetical protein